MKKGLYALVVPLTLAYALIVVFIWFTAPRGTGRNLFLDYIMGPLTVVCANHIAKTAFKSDR